MNKLAGTRGYGGGAEATADLPGQAGDGPGGAQISTDPQSLRGGNAGHALAGGGSIGGVAYGNPFLLPKLGGSGGAGGNGSGNNGGGGSAGAIRLIAPTISGTGTINAQGGANGGSYGRIRLETSRYEGTGAVSPTPVRASPGLVFLPENAPSVRVVSVAGVNAPQNPKGSFFVSVAVTINDPSDVTLAIEARFIPAGTVVKLRIVAENGEAQTVDSTPLQGTLEQSTATATARFAHAFSRVSVSASWTP